MFKGLISIILLGAAVGIFFTKTKDQFAEVKLLRDKTVAYNDALSSSKKIKEKTNQLLNSYNAISQENIDKLNKILPSQFDSIKIAVELENILEKNGMELKTINFKEGDNQAVKKTSSKSKKKKKESAYETTSITFRANGGYESFYSFLNDVERGLRLIDIDYIKFSAKNEGDYDFDIKAVTYWLKESI